VGLYTQTGLAVCHYESKHQIALYIIDPMKGPVTKSLIKLSMDWLDKHFFLKQKSKHNLLQWLLCYNLLFIFCCSRRNQFLIFFKFCRSKLSNLFLECQAFSTWAGLPIVSLGADQPVAWLYSIDIFISRCKSLLGN
jgi:hypothetical protein